MSYTLLLLLFRPPGDSRFKRPLSPAYGHAGGKPASRIGGSAIAVREMSRYGAGDADRALPMGQSAVGRLWHLRLRLSTDAPSSRHWDDVGKLPVGECLEPSRGVPPALYSLIACSREDTGRASQPEATGMLQRQLRLTNSSYSLRPSLDSQSQPSFFGPMAGCGGGGTAHVQTSPSCPSARKGSRRVAASIKARDLPVGPGLLASGKTPSARALPLAR